MSGRNVGRYRLHAGRQVVPENKYEMRFAIQARAQRDPAFRKALLQEGVECLLAGDIDTGKVVLRDYINATIGTGTVPRM